MELLRTDEDRFSGLPDWPYRTHHVEVTLPDLPTVRVGYIDEGPRDAPTVLCLHGEPTWSYLYRYVVAELLDAGLRVVCPDLVGFGRSDKPTRTADHTYARHVGWMTGFVDALDLQATTLVCQDWGGLIGLRVVAERPGRFAGIVAANTGLPTGEQRMPQAWVAFRDWMASADQVQVGQLVSGGCATPLSEAVVAAYDAPFPTSDHQAAVRAMPSLVPTDPDDPGGVANRTAWERLAEHHVPFLCAFSDGDPITAGADRPFRERLPGAEGQPHVTLAGGGHFLQEDIGSALARVTADWIADGHGR